MPELTIESPQGPLKITETAGRITALTWGRGGSESTPLLERTAQQLREYFAGTRRGFDLPLAPAGTAFQKAVWDQMLEIPFGETRSYGELAGRLDSAARAVGGACGKNPIPIIIPCHRVVGSGTWRGGFSGGKGVSTKEELLALEGAGPSQLPLV